MILTKLPKATQIENDRVEILTNVDLIPQPQILTTIYPASHAGTVNKLALLEGS